jgi:DNA-directed RNA polymerase specialized sigma24 family protein
MLEDFSPAEIAALLGLSANVVGVRLNRARALLRELMQPEAP